MEVWIFREYLKTAIAGKTIQDLLSWGKNQAYLALGNLLTVCANEKIDSCPMEGFIPEKYDEVLNLQEKNLTSVLVLPVGFRAEDDIMNNQKKVRKNKVQILNEQEKKCHNYGYCNQNARKCSLNLFLEC